MLHKSDEEIFSAARQAAAVLVSKDEDFVRLLEAHGPPPQVLWVTIGNSRNARLRALFEQYWDDVREQLASGEALVELSDSLPSRD
jgi:predicted nuclease of predicted toxin-antitoxin system